jgi:leader peptidase (prepilin peptidase)/N-methyltransferase
MTSIWLPFLGGFVLGAVIGSFLATLVLRWPQGQSVMRGRSQCDGCGRPLGPLELVPLASFALLGGRCRTCGARIDRRHFRIELAAGLIGAISLFASPDLVGLAGALFGWILLGLALLDLEHFWLPDALTLPLLVLGLLAGILVPEPPLVDRLIGVVAGYGMLTLIAVAYRRFRGREGLGGGDPKLLAAIGAWLGWQALPTVLLGASLVGLAIFAAAWIRGRRVDGQTRMPLGTLMALAAWPTWLASLTVVTR